MLRIAHISDLHVLELKGTPWTRFANKRITGLANLAGARRNSHPVQIARALAGAIKAADIDHVLLTGDVTNLSLPSEFRAARAVVEAIGSPEFVTLVPGNHDVYTAGALRDGRFEAFFDDYLPRPDGDNRHGRDRYPIWREIAPHVRVYGLSSAIPAPPIIAWGEVGELQRKRLVELVGQEPDRITVRIVLVHHNLHTRGPMSERTSLLRDRRQVAATLREIHATALLHGHTHGPNQWHLGRNPSDKPVFVLGCGSSTWSKPDDPDLAHFNVLEVGENGIERVSSLRWSHADAAFRPEFDDLLDRAQARPLSL